uniref:Glutamate--tRNA ligase n=4 Tax=Wuchereria bancrofti TaxID=6293 RepID=A0AAF5PX60_WUCBA
MVTNDDASLESTERRTVIFSISRRNPAYGTVLALCATGFSVEKSIIFTDEMFNEMILDGMKYTNDASMARFIVRSSDKAGDLFGRDIIEQAVVDFWVIAVERYLEHDDLGDLMRSAQEKLKSNLYLCLNRRTLADIMLWTVIAADAKAQQQKPFSTFFESILYDPSFADAHHAIGRFRIGTPEKLENEEVEPKTTMAVKGQKKSIKSVEGKKAQDQVKDEGKFIELPGAEKGKVVVRFPPEASGYLHIGHAKAALLNQYYQQTFEGELIMRFDDTNPAKENAHFEQVILEDLKMLEVKPDRWTYTSDHFDLILEMCERLLQEGKAYVDDTDAELMRKEREERKESRCRNNTPEQNLALWVEMKQATTKGQKCCVRIKIDMQSNNGAMRDPTIYRCRAETHVRTGNKYKVYPTYDFACPIVDSIEGVTHALRTTEYTDRDDQYYFICDVLGLRKPYIWSYARLNMTNTVMSKRKLTWLVDEHHVEGWDDPRLPTVRGIMRRGLTVEGLKQFIIAQGGSRAIVMMEWDKIWSFNKKVIDPVAPRYTALACPENLVQVVVMDNLAEESKKVSLHPKNHEVGTKTVWYSKKMLVEEADAREMKIGDSVTFINWGNIKICDILKDDDRITEIRAKLDLDNKDYKKTLKVTWIADTKMGPQIPVKIVEYSHIISKPVIGKDEDWKQFVNYDSAKYVDFTGEPAMKEIRKGVIIQLQRKGYYICDLEYTSKSEYSGFEVPIVLILIPDGSSKPVKQAQTASTIELGRTNGDIQINGNALTSQMDILRLSEQIKEQSDLVRSLKAADAKGVKTKEAIATLLNLKKTLQEFSVKENTKKLSPSDNASDLYQSIEKQGNLVRSLKATDPKSDETKAAISKLLELKKQYKDRTGSEYKPGLTITQKQVDVTMGNIEELYKQIEEQGNIVRTLKAANPKSEEAKAAIAKLLNLKQKYKEISGMEYKPKSILVTPSDNKLSNSAKCKETFAKKIAEQGDLVRSLKAKDAKSQEAKDAIAELLRLKKQYKDEFGEDYTANATNTNSSTAKKVVTVTNEERQKGDGKKERKGEVKSKTTLVSTEMMKQTKLGLDVKKEENLAEWYSQIIIKADMIEYYDVSGCYILRPWSFAIWEIVKKWFDTEIKKRGVRNCYFPIFVSQNGLQREKEHIDDFAPEVAWVTRAGDSELGEPIAIRPTSETVMYPSYAKWIQSYRDLPIRLNQWCNVVRWEFKHPTPFLRTREFLWQEGHTAFQTKQEAEQEVFTILDLYAKVYTDLFAIPVIKGRKSEKEKFAGGDFTTTIEAYVPVNGRGIQGATSHHLGQNFSKMFDISFEDPETGKKTFVWQNSWGMTTRTIGAMIMIHSDNDGLVLPPRVAPIQVIIIPVGITSQMDKKMKQEIITKIEEIMKTLENTRIRVDTDLRDNYSPGWKFNHWELKGVPIRLELGPKDIEKSQVTCVTRYNKHKSVIPIDNLLAKCFELLDEIHTNMYINTKRIRDQRQKITKHWSEFKELLDQKCLILAAFCGLAQCEDNIKKDSSNDECGEIGAPVMGAKTLCIPLEQPSEQLPVHCIHPECKEQPKFYALFGRSY